MKNKSYGVFNFIVIIIIVGISIKFCTAGKESDKAYSPDNLIDTTSTLKDSVVINKATTAAKKKIKKSKKKTNLQSTETVATSLYSTSASTTSKKTETSSADNNSSGCSSRQ